MTIVRQSELITSWQGKTVLVLGDVMVDQYLWGDSDRLSPEAPVPVVEVSRRELRPGGAANAALNLQRLGARVILCGLIGQDRMGEELARLLEKRGFNPDALVRSASRRTTVKTRVMARGQQMIRVDEEDTFPLSDPERAAIQELIRNIPEPDGIVFSDYDKGVLDKALIAWTIGKAQQQGIFTAVDPKFRQFFDYTHCDLFKPNLRELNEATGTQHAGTSHPAIRDAVRALRHRMPHRYSLITLGSQGMLCLEEDGPGAHIPARLREVVDVSGAGDTVIAVATLSMLSGASLSEAAHLANLAAGLACDIAGVAPVDAEMLRKALQT